MKASKMIRNGILSALLTLFCLTGAMAEAGSYVDTQNGFEIVANNGWEVSEDGPLVVTSPESTERQTINFTVQVIPAGEFTAESFASILKAQAEQGFKGKVVEESAAQVDGNPAQKLVWETQNNAQISRNITIVTVKNDKLYMLNGRLPKARFAELQGEIAGLVASFQLK